MNKFLFKRAFKSLFKNKIFVILMSVLVLITGAAYTMLESSSSSFKNSYDQVMSKGALHDLVIKENFQISAQDKVEVKVKSPAGNGYDVQVSAVDSSKKLISTNGTVENYSVDFIPDKDYSKYGLSESDLTISETFSLDKNDVITSQLINDLASKAKAFIESKLRNKLKESFIDSLNEIYSDPNNAYASDVADFNEMSALSVTAGVSAFKVIKYNSDTKVNVMNIYDGSNKFIPSLSDTELNAALDKKINDANVATQAVFGAANTSKGYKVTAQSSVGDVLTVTDASAYQAIISPTYANQNNKKALTNQEFLNLVNKFPFVDSVNANNRGAKYNFFDALSNKIPELVESYNDNII